MTDGQGVKVYASSGRSVAVGVGVMLGVTLGVAVNVGVSVGGSVGVALGNGVRVGRGLWLDEASACV